MQQDT